MNAQPARVVSAEARLGNDAALREAGSARWRKCRFYDTMIDRRSVKS